MQIFRLPFHQRQQQQQHRLEVIQAAHLQVPVKMLKIQLKLRKHVSIATLYQQLRLKHAQQAALF